MLDFSSVVFLLGDLVFNDTVVTTRFLSQSSQGIDYGNCVHCMINKSAFTGGNSRTYITLKL